MARLEFPGIAVDLKKLPDEEISFYLARYNANAQAYLPHRLRYQRNMKAYASLGKDMWSQSLLADLSREGRDVNTYNFSQYIIDGVTGNYIMNWFDPKFNDREDDDEDVQNGVTALQKKYYADKKKHHYKTSALRSIRNGNIGGGWEELVIDRSEDKRGSVKFETIRTDMIIPDMENLDDEVSRKANILHKEFHMTAEQMELAFPHASAQVRDAINNQKKSDTKDTRAEQNTVDKFGGEPFSFGRKHLVVECYHIEQEKQRIIRDRKTLKEYPDTGLDFGTPEDFYAKLMYAQQNGMSDNVEDMVVTQESSPVLYCTTFCPSLAVILENRKDERQLNGHMPFYAWSFIMVNGIMIGIMDLIYDACQDINKREATKARILASSANKKFIHPEGFGGSGEKLDEAVRDSSDPAKPYVFDEGAPAALAASFVGVVNGQQISPDILRDETVKIEFLNKIGRLPLSMQGITEKSGESGVLMARKVIEGSVMQRVPMEFILSKERHKARDWVKMNIKLCGGDGDENRRMANLNRKFRDVSGGEVIMNEVLATDESGRPTSIKAEIAKLKTVEVDISESKENDMVRQMKRETYMGALQAMRPSATNGPILTEIEAGFALNLDYATTDEREQAEAAVEKSRKLANAQADMALIQMESQIKNSTPAPGGQPPAPEGAENFNLMGEREPVPEVEPVG